MNTTVTPRIEPIKGVELNPQSGGCWVRDDDGGLTPADPHTAAAAGLSWPADKPTTQLPDLET